CTTSACTGSLSPTMRSSRWGSSRAWTCWVSSRAEAGARHGRSRAERRHHDQFATDLAAAPAAFEPQEHTMSTTSRKHGVFGRETRHGGAAGHRQHEPATQRTDAPVPPERIQARAYEIYEARTREGSPGDAMSDWLQAER